MATDTDPTHVPVAPAPGSNPTYGVGMNYNGVNIGMQNPGMMDPSGLNPYASGYLNNLNNLYGMFQGSAAGGAFNPDFYKHMQDTSQANLTTGIENSYARMGMGGSSAAMGSVSSGIERNQMDWMNRQQSDQMRAMQGLMGLNTAGYGETMGIQGQYGNFQDASNQDIISLLGIKAAQEGGNNDLLGNILKGLGAAAGGVAGLFGGGGKSPSGGGGNVGYPDPTSTDSGWGSYTDPAGGTNTGGYNWE